MIGGGGVQKSFSRTDPTYYLFFIILGSGKVKTISGPSAATRTG